LKGEKILQLLKNKKCGEIEERKKGRWELEEIKKILVYQ